MKRPILLLAAAAMLSAPLAGCGPAKHHHETHQVKQKIYHFSDGRLGYQGNDGIWWYWMMANNGSGSTTVVNTGGGSSGLTSSPNNITIPESGARGALSSPQGAAPAAPAPVAESARGGFGSSAQTYGMTGGQWAKGNPPTEEELATATVTEETVVENENGQPGTEAQAEGQAAEGQAAEGGAAAPAEGGEAAGGSSGGGSSGGDGGGGGGGGDGGGGGSGGD